MAEAQDLTHRYTQNPALPYRTNDSPTSKEPQFGSGSSNTLTSIKGYAERRNGFAPYLTDTTFTFTGSIARFFTWRRWSSATVTLSGQYFEMVNEITATQSKVYKRRIGTDVYPSVIFTSSTSTNIFDFVVSNDFLFFGNGVDMQKYDGSNVWLWGITGPSVAVTLSTTAGALSPVIGYRYVIAWESSASFHISSPSPVSASTGPLSLSNIIVTGNTSTDSQVTTGSVHIFRTIDGGSIFFEHPSSPVSYTTWIASGLTDSATDPDPNNPAATSLTSQVAPLPNQNNRPTASFDPVYFANRIWTHAGDTLYYSCFEELVRGVEEEAFSSINLRAVGQEIVGKRVAGSFLLIYTADVIYRIYGDSLATFRFDTLATGKGALNRAAIVPFRGLVAWLDSSNCIFATDGQTVPEIDLSEPIRPDISSIVHSTAAMAFYSTGNSHWLILLDGTNGKLFVYDLDTKQWMPPWSITNLQTIYSAQVAPGTYRLFLGRNNKPLALGTGYQDDSVSYAANLYTNLFDIVPTENPSNLGIMDHVEVETDSHPLTTLKYETDEDPTSATWQTAAQVIDPPRRTQGTALVEKWYQTISDPNNRGARRIALQLNIAEANATFKIYGIAIAFKLVD